MYSIERRITPSNLTPRTLHTIGFNASQLVASTIYKLGEGMNQNNGYMFIRGENIGLGAFGKIASARLYESLKDLNAGGYVFVSHPLKDNETKKLVKEFGPEGRIIIVFNDSESMESNTQYYNTIDENIHLVCADMIGKRSLLFGLSQEKKAEYEKSLKKIMGELRIILG